VSTEAGEAQGDRSRDRDRRRHRRPSSCTLPGSVRAGVIGPLAVGLLLGTISTDGLGLQPATSSSTDLLSRPSFARTNAHRALA